MDLNEARTIKVPTLIEVRGRRSNRPLKLGEALQTVLGSLGTLASRTSGVKAINGEIDGQPVALAVIEGASFGEDDDGNTTLNGLEEQNEQK